MSPEKKLTSLAWHCGLETKAVFQGLAAIEGMTASELLDKLATEYIQQKVTHARLVLEAVSDTGSLGTMSNAED